MAKTLGSKNPTVEELWRTGGWALEMRTLSKFCARIHSSQCVDLQGNSVGFDWRIRRNYVSKKRQSAQHAAKSRTTSLYFISAGASIGNLAVYQ